MVGSATIYLQPPILYLGWAVGLFLSIGCPLGIFAWNQYQLRRSEDEIGELNRDEIGEIVDSPPSLKDEQTRVEGSWLAGYRLAIKLKIRNNRSVVLDGMDATLEVIDLDRNKRKQGDYLIPDLAPRESQEQTFKLGLGRSIPKKYKVIFVAYRMGIEVARKHFTVQRGLFDFYQSGYVTWKNLREDSE